MPVTDPKTNRTVLTPSEATAFLVTCATLDHLAKVTDDQDCKPAALAVAKLREKYEKKVKPRGAATPAAGAK